MSFLSRNTYTGDGSTTDYTVSFPYLETTHVKVYLDEVLKVITTDYTWVNSTTVRFVSAPALDVAISIQRDTSSSTRLVDYVSGSSLNESDLDTDSLQAFYLSQEALDRNTAVAFANQIAFTPGGNLAATDVQAALEELDVEKSDTSHVHAVATSGANGFMSAADRTKLDGIEAGAEVNVVDSVAGKTGAVTLVKGDVGLGNVDNTSDANKPLSTAATTALAGKSDTSHTHPNATTLEDGFMSAEDKTVLDGLAAGGVASFEGRTGAVTAAGGDYTAEMITNDSGVSGADVAAALDTLDAALANKQGLDTDLTALAGVSANGLLARTGSGTAEARTLTAPAAGITVSPGGGVAGNPTLALANDLSALEGLSGTGIAVRTGTDAWAQRSIAAGAGIAVSNGDGVSANPSVAADIGKQSIWVPAGAMKTRTTNGAATGTVETTTNKVMIATLDFDASTQEFAQFGIRMPKSWDEGTVTFIPVWGHASTSTNFGVVWQLAGVAFSDDDAMDTAFGTAQTSTDTGGTTNDSSQGPESSAITIAGSPAAGDYVVFQVARVPASGSDTMAIDARLIGVLVLYTINALKDD